MTKERDGYHNAFMQLPQAVWDRLCAIADAEGTSATRVATRVLVKGLGISQKGLPKPRRAGRKPREK